MSASTCTFLKKLIVGLALLLASAGVYGYDIAITVAPNVLNMGSESYVVTVHTDIAYSSVNAYTVYLNGVAIKSWKADNRGNFVAKFWMSEIKALDGLKIGDYNTMTLNGYTWSEVPFIGSDDILVIDNVPSGARR